MTIVLKAALNERELLVSDNEALEQIVADDTEDVIERAAADIRLQANKYALDVIEGLICRLLEKIPLDLVMDDINNNLSSKCN